MTSSRLLLLLPLAACVLVACRPSTGVSTGRGPQPEPVAVSLAPVAIRAVPRSIEVTGTLYGNEETTISAELSGRVVEILKDLGDRAGPGEPLARIDPRDYELAAAQARAGLASALAKVGLSELPAHDFDPSTVPTVVSARAEAANAQARYERGRTLYEESPPMISAQEFADLQTARDVAAGSADVALLNARAALADARMRAAEVAVSDQRISDTTVRAPGAEGGNGPTYSVSGRSVSLGEYVSAGQPMYSLVATDPIRFRASVPERYAADIRPGQEASARVEAYRESFTGRVARVSPRVDPGSRTFEVQIDIPDPDGRLKPGQFARGAITTRTDEGVVFVPAEAVVTFAGVEKVFTVKDGKAVEHRVRTGIQLDNLVEIASGLEAEAVVTSGAPSLSNNAPVTVAP